jgi:hypothetical protein
VEIAACQRAGVVEDQDDAVEAAVSVGIGFSAGIIGVAFGPVNDSGTAVIDPFRDAAVVGVRDHLCPDRAGCEVCDGDEAVAVVPSRSKAKTYAGGANATERRQRDESDFTAAATLFPEPYRRTHTLHGW